MRHFVLILGTWKLQNWHLYRWRLHRSVKDAKVQWHMWERVL